MLASPRRSCLTLTVGPERVGEEADLIERVPVEPPPAHYFCRLHRLLPEPAPLTRWGGPALAVAARVACRQLELGAALAALDEPRCLYDRNRLSPGLVPRIAPLTPRPIAGIPRSQDGTRYVVRYRLAGPGEPGMVTT